MERTGMTRTDIIVLPLASLNDEQTQKCKDTLFLSQIRNYLLRSNHAGVSIRNQNQNEQRLGKSRLRGKRQIKILLSFCFPPLIFDIKRLSHHPEFLSFLWELGFRIPGLI